MRTFKIVDTGPAFTWYREAEVLADNREHAQELYIDQCEANGVTHGTLHVFAARTA